MTVFDERIQFNEAITGIRSDSIVLGAVVSYDKQGCMPIFNLLSRLDTGVLLHEELGVRKNGSVRVWDILVALPHSHALLKEKGMWDSVQSRSALACSQWYDLSTGEVDLDDPFSINVIVELLLYRAMRDCWDGFVGRLDVLSGKKGEVIFQLASQG
jgi:hypothetical protein